MFISRRLAFFALLALLAACAKPTSYSPAVTPQELAAEEGHQAELIRTAQNTKDGRHFLNREEMKERLGRISKPIGKAGGVLCQELGKSRCYFEFQLDKDGEPLNAFADGERIVISPAMMKFASMDEELAMVMSHELAHNMMEHPQAQHGNQTVGVVAGSIFDVLAASQGVDTGGAFGSLGGQASTLAYSQSFEKEADYIGLYILAHSGYHVERAANFWRRMTVNDPKGIYAGQTHPSNPERFIAISKTIKEIDFKKAHGLALVPEFKQAN